MVFTAIMFFVLITLFVMMLGLVKFSENVMGTRQLPSLDDSTPKKSIRKAESL